MKALELVAGFPIQPQGGDWSVEVSGIACDSRELQPGWAFVALKGEHADAEAFIPQAIQKGAVLILGESEATVPEERAWGRLIANPRETMALLARRCHGTPDQRLALIGVTGTNGKTTTTTLIRQLLRGAGQGCGMIGTVINAAGDHEEEAVRTTPESPVFYRWLRRSVDAGDVASAVEVSSHSLCLQRVHGARFKLGLFTNLTQDHLDFHGDMETYYQAKARLFAQCEGGLVNADDTFGQRLIRAHGLQSYGFCARADYQGSHLELGPTGTRFTLTTTRGQWRIESPLLGRFNAYNLLAALAACAETGFCLDELTPAVAHVQGAPGRLDRADLGQPFGVLVDYAHTPDALEKLLVAGRDLLAPGARLHVLFGCGGDRDRTKRPLMASAVAKGADVIWHTSDNTRTEAPERILDDAAQGVPPEILRDEHRYHRIADRALAVKAAVEACRPGDLLLLAGKGHEPYQDVMGVKHPYSDRAAVEAALRGELVARPWNGD